MVNVCIPTIGLSTKLDMLLGRLHDDPAVKRIGLYVNEPEAVEYLPGGSKVTVYITEPQTIYPAWNDAIRKSRLDGARLAILNDDIVFPYSKPITKAMDVWKTLPDVAVLGFDHTQQVPHGSATLCRGSFRHHGVPGFAFMVDPARVRLVDARFTWYYGDDDLFFTAEKEGHKLARCYVPVLHQAETTSSVRPWTHEAVVADREEWIAKWGDV